MNPKNGLLSSYKVTKSFYLNVGVAGVFLVMMREGRKDGRGMGCFFSQTNRMRRAGLFHPTPSSLPEKPASSFFSVLFYLSFY